MQMAILLSIIEEIKNGFAWKTINNFSNLEI